jgi:hypothetical protein
MRVTFTSTLISLKCRCIEVHIIYLPVTNVGLVYLYGTPIMMVGRLFYKSILSKQCRRTGVVHIGRLKFGESNLLISIPSVAITANYDKYFS